MKVYNTSRLKTRDLFPLIEFAASRCKAAYMAHLIVEDGPDHYRCSDGFSWQREGDDPTAPSRVKIWIGDTKYPNTMTYRKAVGPITVTTWQEEFLLVLAHELRHIDQFWSTEDFPAQHEVDAERFGLKVLNEWRTEQQRRGIAHAPRLASRTAVGSTRQRRAPARAA